MTLTNASGKLKSKEKNIMYGDTITTKFNSGSESWEGNFKFQDWNQLSHLIHNLRTMKLTNSERYLVNAVGNLALAVYGDGDKFGNQESYVYEAKGNLQLAKEVIEALCQ